MKFQKWKDHVIGLEIGLITLNSPERLFKNLSEANASKSGPILQAISLSLIVSEKQLVSGAIQALNAFESGAHYSPSLANEILLRTTGSRQMEEVIQLLELKEGKNEIAFITIGEQKKSERKLREFLSESKKEFTFKKSAFPKLTSKKTEFIIGAYDLKKYLNGKNGTERGLEKMVIEKMALNGVEN